MLVLGLALVPPGARAQIAPGGVFGGSGGGGGGAVSPGGAFGTVPSGVIQEILVEGNQRIEADTVRSYMQMQPGEPFDPARVDQALKAMFATGLFADVSIQRVGDRLLVRVVENPIINRIAFEGNSKLSDEVLLAEVQLKPRVVYTRARVQSDVQRLAQLYRRSGRFAATIEPKVIQLEQNRVDLVYEINEGAVTGIEKIRIIGNERISDSRLTSAIATKESRWYRFLTTDDTYDPDRITFDRELLRRYYLTRGFADFRVVSAVAELTPEKDAFFLTFTVEEGEEYKFGAIDIRSEIKDLPVSTLMKQLTTEPGDTYNAEEIEKSIENITFELGKLGYAFVDVRPEVDRDRENRRIGIVYVINEGPRVFVERINITGNVRTIDEVIRREFRLAEGDAFNTAKLRRSRARIRGLGFFDKVEVNQVQGSAPDRTVINVEVQERSTGEISFGAGYSTTDAIIADITIRERNLLGRGQDLRASLSGSRRRQQIDLSFTEPYFLDRELAAGFDLFKRRLDFQTFSGFDLDSTGGALRTTFPITEFLSASLSYTIRADDISNVNSRTSRFIRQEEGLTITSQVGYRLTHDTRDDRLEPTKGHIIRFGQDFAGLGGDIRLLRNSLAGVRYFPVVDGVVFSLGVESGYVIGLGQDVDVNNRFFVGGDNFRGFRQRGIGPRDIGTRDALGGNIYYVGTAEVEFPLGLPQELGVAGRVFSQAGSLWDIDASGPGLFDSSDLRATVGVGVSWRSPFGPIRLDLAVPLLEERPDRREIFRFSFGTRF
ncbi:MAG: outer membrane protein assembly factor BamA [Alphaproteobacteria bacterium]|nr:outer membrane protein assembly factor BamA [Alphaproteobacteria bacterium]